MFRGRQSGLDTETDPRTTSMSTLNISTVVIGTFAAQALAALCLVTACSLYISSGLLGLLLLLSPCLPPPSVCQSVSQCVNQSQSRNQQIGVSLLASVCLFVSVSLFGFRMRGFRSTSHNQVPLLLLSRHLTFYELQSKNQRSKSQLKETEVRHEQL